MSKTISSNPWADVAILSGPNGAGKSTVAPVLLPRLLGVQRFVNADSIADGLSPFGDRASDRTAGRVMLEQLRELAASGTSFCFETTLASRTFAPWLRGLRQRGYTVHLLYLWLDSPELAMMRVAERVRRGGHDIPGDVIRRRYVRGLKNLFELYLQLADTWRVYDNSGGQPELVARGGLGLAGSVQNQTVWSMIESGGKSR